MAAPTDKQLKAFVKPRREARGVSFEWVVSVTVFGALAVAASVLLLHALALVDGTGLWGVGPVLGMIDFDTPDGLVRRAVVAVVAAAVGMLSMALVLRSLLPPRRGSGHLVVSADERGVVLVEPEGICTVAAEPIYAIPGVLECSVEAVSQGQGPLRLVVEIWVSAAADLKVVGDRARTEAAASVEELLGIGVQAVLVTFQVVPLKHVKRALR